MIQALHFLPVYSPAWQFGGPVLSVSRLCEGLVRQGVRVRVLTTNYGLPDFPPDQLGVPQMVNGVEVIYYPVDRQSGTIRSISLEKNLEHHLIWADLLHLSSVWQPLGVSLQRVAHRHNVPVIQSLRGALGPYSWSQKIYKKLPYYLFIEFPLLQQASRIHCTTLQEVSETKRLLLKPQIELLPNPLDLSSFYHNPTLGTSWRTHNNIPLDHTVFLIAGRLHHKKGLDLLPNCLKDLPSHKWTLCIIGEDDDGSGHQLRNALDRHGLSRRCHWFPSVPSADLLSPLNAADWLLLPSRHENFGNIVVESLSCGCGVLISDRVGVKDMLAGCPGVLSGPRRRNTWTKLMKSAVLRERPSSASETWIHEHFNQDLIAANAYSLYKKILLNG